MVRQYIIDEENIDLRLPAAVSYTEMRRGILKSILNSAMSLSTAGVAGVLIMLLSSPAHLENYTAQTR